MLQAYLCIQQAGQKPWVCLICYFGTVQFKLTVTVTKLAVNGKETNQLTVNVTKLKTSNYNYIYIHIYVSGAHFIFVHY